LNSNIKSSTEAHKELIATINTEAGGVRNLESSYNKLAARMEKTRARQQALSANLAARDANRGRMSELHSGMLGTVMAAASVAAPIKMAMEFESGMADAAKTIEGMRDEAGNLTPMYHAMTREALLLGREMPLAHSELASMMASAGQQGLSDVKEISTYTRDAAMMAVAFGMGNEEAAESIGGYRTALGLAQDDVRNMLDLMNYFANTSSASEAGIADIVRRVGALGGVAGVSHKPMTALAATLDSMKIAPEVAATGIQNLMLAMVAGSSTTKRQDIVLRKLGVDAEELAKRMQTDATGAILDFLKAVKQLPEHEQAAALKNYFGKESIKSIAPLLTQLDLLESNFARVGDESSYAGSMAKEFASRAATTAGAAQVAKNKAAELAITLGKALLPAVNDGFIAFGNMATHVTELAARYPQVTRAVGLAAAGVVGLSVGIKVLAYSYYFLKGGLLTAQGALMRFQSLSMLATGPARLLWAVTMGLGGGMLGLARFIFFTDLATKRAIISQKAVAAAMMVSRLASLAAGKGFKIMRAALIGTGVGAILVGVGLAAGWIIENWDRVGPYFSRLWSWISGIFMGGWNFIRSGAESVFNYLSEKFEWFRESVAGLQKAWNFFFGEDDKAATVATASSAAAANMQNVAAPAAAPMFSPGPFAAVPQIQPPLAAQPVVKPFAQGTLTPPSPTAAPLMAGGGVGLSQDIVGLSSSLSATDAELAQLNTQLAGLGGPVLLNQDYANFDIGAALAGLGQPGAAEYTNSTQITLEMAFDVKGLDEGEFRKKITGYRGEFEKIVRGVVGDMERTQARTKFAQ
ncbi:MAG: phage tail tape measure protein, partial [Candidatus Adiutrix sp.]|nr:phage tail tape measure protein [Candidatus Adiutrix sp.]